MKFSWRSSLGHSESRGPQAGRPEQAGPGWLPLGLCLPLCFSLSHTHPCPSGGHIQTPALVLPGKTGRPSGTRQEALTWPPEAVCGVCDDAGCHWTWPCAHTQTSLSYLARPSGTRQEALTWPPEAVLFSKTLRDSTGSTDVASRGRVWGVR